MSDIIFVYRTVVPVMDTSIRLPPGGGVGAGDLILQTDGSSSILLIDNTSNLLEGY
jgi:hypothetical protein